MTTYEILSELIYSMKDDIQENDGIIDDKQLLILISKSEKLRDVSIEALKALRK